MKGELIMKYYIYLENNAAHESIPEFNEIVFPGVPVTERYAPDFLKQCVEWYEPVPYGWIYDEASDTFSEPPEPAEPAIAPAAETAAIPTTVEQLLLEKINELEKRLAEVEEEIEA